MRLSIFPRKTWGASQGAMNVDFPNRMIVGQRWDGYLDVSRNTVGYLGSVQKWGMPKNCNFMTEYKRNLEKLFSWGDQLDETISPRCSSCVWGYLKQPWWNRSALELGDEQSLIG